MKNRYWLIINSIFFALFVYLYLGIYLCDDFSALYSSSSGFLFDCGFLHLVLASYFFVFWIFVTAIGLLYYWISRKVKNALKISAAFIVSSFLILNSVSACQSIIKTLGDFKKTEQSRLNESRRLNTEGNYEIEYCEDLLNNDGIINLSCNVSVGLSGKYTIKGQLYKNNPNITGHDEIVLESHTSVFEIGRNTVVDIPFEYRHISRNKPIPNGPYIIELILIPEGVLKDQLNTCTFSGFEDVASGEDVEYKESFVTDYYEGSSFEDLPYKDIRDL